MTYIRNLPMFENNPQFSQVYQEACFSEDRTEYTLNLLGA